MNIGLTLRLNNGNTSSAVLQPLTLVSASPYMRMVRFADFGLVTAALPVAASAVSRIGRSPTPAPNSCSIRFERVFQ